MTTKTPTLARDLLTRAGHTAYQAAAATAAVLWAQSGLHLTDLAHADGWAKLWSAVVVGALAAAVSAVKTTALGYVAVRRAKLIASVQAQLLGAQPKLAVDVAKGNVGAVVEDVKTTAAKVETAAVAVLEPTSVDGKHPAAADPDNKPPTP